MRLPRNAGPIVAARRRGEKPADMVIVSFVGATEWPNPHVFAESGQAYDWRFLAGLDVAIVVKPGIDASDAMRKLALQASEFGAYPSLIDVERKQAGCIVWTRPFRVWAVREDSPLWTEMFG